MDFKKAFMTTLYFFYFIASVGFVATICELAKP